MFLLSLLLILAAGGLSFLALWLYVVRIAYLKPNMTLQSKTVLVLGKRLNNNQPDHDFILRLKRAAIMLLDKTSNKIYVLGGKTRNSGISEAAAGKEFLIREGINGESIILEEKSQNTLENLKHFHSISDNKKQKISLITNRYHLARSVIMAKGFGINTQACPAENKFQFSIKNIVNTLVEAFHMHWYFTGKYWAKLTNNKNILSRIT